MAQKKDALGKGLGAIFSDLLDNDTGKKTTANICGIEELRPNQYQPRKNFNDEDQKKLIASIKQSGIIQPIIVRKADAGYEIIAGERRWRAAQAAGLKEVPIVIRKASDREATELSLIENLLKQDAGRFVLNAPWQIAFFRTPSKLSLWAGPFCNLSNALSIQEIQNYGFSGVMAAAAVVFFGYIGFDAVSTTAEEAKNPQRDMPVGILASLAVCTVLYVAVSAVLTGMVHYSELNTPAPVALALDRHPELSWLAGWIKLGAIAGMTSVMLVMLLGQPRIFYAMSRDGLLPPVFRRVHPTHKTPYVGTLITGSLAALIAGLFPVTILGELVSIGTLLAFTTVCIGVLVLRYTRPDIPRHFKVPAPWFVCIAGALVCTGMMVSLPKDTWVRLAGWTVVGLLVYFLYGFKHSELRKTGR